MPDLFISYAREDRETAHALAEALQRSGLVVWWDRSLTGGGDFADEIEQNLLAAKVVIVLWSPPAARSDFVRDEAGRARELKTLLPVRIAPVELPLGFGTLHTLELTEWDGDTDDDGFVALQEQVRQRLARHAAGAGKPAAPETMAESSATALLQGRRWRRRLLGALGGVALVGAGGGGWLAWRETQQRRGVEHLGQGIADHFAQPPRLEKAESEYSQALQFDPGLAPAHYYLAHLYAQMMLRGSPPPAGEVLEALRADSRRHFELALAGAEELNGSQRVIAKAQFALLDQRDEAAPLTRSVAAAPPPGDTPAAADTQPAPDSVAATATPEPTGSVESPTAAGTSPTSGSAGSPAPAPATRPAAIAGRPSPALSGAVLASPSIALSAAPPSPPRVAPPAAAQQAAQRRGEALFTADRDNRLAATTALTLDPALAADTLPGAIRSATAALLSAPGVEATQQGLASTLALLERASPSTLRENRTAVQELLRATSAAGGDGSAPVQRLRDVLARSQRSRPVAYIQIAHENQRAIAQTLARQLVAAGYTTPAIENTGAARAPNRPSVRSQGASDPDLARWCQRALSAAVGVPAELVTLRAAKATTDTFELWFDKALCAPDGRAATGCV